MLVFEWQHRKEKPKIKISETALLRFYHLLPAAIGWWRIIFIGISIPHNLLLEQGCKNGRL
jgi:hypothetical protein